MRIQVPLTLLWLATSATSKLLVDYNASRDDTVSEMGQLNLEEARKHTIPSNTADLYIQAGKDWRGAKAAHFHRKRTTSGSFVTCPSSPPPTNQPVLQN
jgi:hypothetical protein